MLNNMVIGNNTTHTYLAMPIDDNIAMRLIDNRLFDDHYLPRDVSLGGIPIDNALATRRTDWLDGHALALAATAAAAGAIVCELPRNTLTSCSKQSRRM